MIERRNEKLDAFHRKLDEFRVKLAAYAKAHPESTLRIVPKRTSGPHLGPWHEPHQQAEMVLRDEGRLSDEYCAGCGHRVVRASGELIHAYGGRWCGACILTEMARHGDQIPPSAA